MVTQREVWWRKDGRLRPALRVLVFVAVQALVLTAVATVLYTWIPPVDDAAAEALELILQSMAIIGVSFFLRRVLDRASIRSLGFADTGWSRRLTLGLLIGASMQVAIVAVEVAARAASIEFPDGSTSIAYVFFAIPVLALAAVAEEVAVRGYMLVNLREEVGTLPAVLLTACIFASLHAMGPHVFDDGPFAFVDLAVFGLWAAYAVVVTRSLWLAIGAHFAWNFFEGPIFGAPVSGLTMASLYHTQADPNGAWVTGGAYGPEAGVAALVALALGFLAVAALDRRGSIRRRRTAM